MSRKSQKQEFKSKKNLKHQKKKCIKQWFKNVYNVYYSIYTFNFDIDKAYKLKLISTKRFGFKMSTSNDRDEALLNVFEVCMVKYYIRNVL